MESVHVDGSFIDALHLFLKDEKMIRFNTIQGTIIFYKDQDVEKDALYIYSIVVDEQLRRQGIFKTLLQYMIDNCSEKRIIGMLAVGSPILIEFLSKYSPMERFLPTTEEIIYGQELVQCANVIIILISQK